MQYELDPELPDDGIHVVKNLKKGQAVEITTEEGTYTGVVHTLTNVLVVIVMLEPFTSLRMHAHHWAKESFKSTLFKRLLAIKRI